jgi:flagellar basal body rod protein FlgF
VDITTTQPGWLEVILLDGKKGWIPTGDVRAL